MLNEKGNSDSGRKIFSLDVATCFTNDCFDEHSSVAEVVNLIISLVPKQVTFITVVLYINYLIYTCEVN